MTTTNPATSTKVVTDLVRFSFLNVFTPKAIEPGGEEKYSVSLIIRKDDAKTLAKINKVIELLKEQAKQKFGGKIPANFKLPLRDGDTERDDEAYRGCYFVNASAKTKPGVVDANLNAILDPEQVYSGCYGRASVNFYLFDKSGNRGIACGLNNLQKLKDGEHLGGRMPADVDFGDGFGESFADNDDIF